MSFNSTILIHTKKYISLYHLERNPLIIGYAVILRDQVKKNALTLVKTVGTIFLGTIVIGVNAIAIGKRD